MSLIRISITFDQSVHEVSYLGLIVLHLRSNAGYALF